MTLFTPGSLIICLLLGVTILLSLTIFLNTVSSIIPITSDSPLIGTASHSHSALYIFTNLMDINLFLCLKI